MLWFTIGPLILQIEAPQIVWTHLFASTLVWKTLSSTSVWVNSISSKDQLGIIMRRTASERVGELAVLIVFMALLKFAFVIFNSVHIDPALVWYKMSCCVCFISVCIRISIEIISFYIENTMELLYCYKAGLRLNYI